MWLTTVQLILVDYDSRIKEIFQHFGKFAYCRNPYLSGSPPFNYQYLVPNPKGRDVSCSANRVEVNSAAPPSIKSIKYTTQQFQNALMDLVSHLPDCLDH